MERNGLGNFGRGSPKKPSVKLFQNRLAFLEERLFKLFQNLSRFILEERLFKAKS